MNKESYQRTIIAPKDSLSKRKDTEGVGSSLFAYKGLKWKRIPEELPNIADILLNGLSI